MANDPNAIGQSFVSFYYQAFDSDRTQLANLFTEQSMMTYEGSQHQGQQSIMQKLTTLQFNKISHEPKTMDVQPSGPGLLVIVTGDLFVDGSKNPIKFCEVFHLLKKKGTNAFWIHNLVFRLNYC